MKEYLQPDEVIVGILANIKKPEFKIKDRTFQEFFYNSAKKYPNLFSLFYFEVISSKIPFSSSLETAFFNLELGYYLTSQISLGNKNYIITNNLKKYYKSRLKQKLSKKQINDLEKIALEFSKNFIT